MRYARRFLAPLATVAFLAAPPVLADGPVCAPVTKVPLERHLRQLSLDLLGRPPTYEEYQAIRAKGEVTVEDVRAMMDQEEFYARIRAYHRALLWSNINSSVNNNNNSRLYGDGSDTNALSLRSNSSVQLRGVNNAGCDSYLAQDVCNARQDPHADPALPSTAAACAKERYDERGVPNPVSWDYNTNYYTCTPLSVTDCSASLGADAKYLYFCDMRRVTIGEDAGKLKPYLCKPTSANFSAEVLDGAGKVVAFEYPDAPSNVSVKRLDRCTLNLTLRNGVKGSYVPQTGCVQREGYVTRPAPFWNAGGPEVRVCAIEAQTRAANPWTLEPCTTSRFNNDRSCGCGEGMARCESSDNNGSTHRARVKAINTEPELIAESVIRRDEPYYNFLTTRRSFANGPLAALYRDPQQGVGVFNVARPKDPSVLPDIPYAEADTWKEYVRGPEHSGVLTTPSFLYRFPTLRARVNHFYGAFLCKSFVPPDNARQPAAEDACNRENNLAKRCGCSYCHATIEPTGAHWGRFAERSAQFLDPEHFPRYDPKCRDCALSGNTGCNNECGQYVMQAYDGDGAQSLGMLKTYLYRNADEEANIDGGPELLVERMLQTGDLERCTVRRVWQEFLGRPMSVEEQRMYLEPFAQEFARDGHRFKALIERVLMSDAYRRID
ncbi:DUF1585 domain-containing protein [Archangium violaceum]|uniref:DUF1585 domain-containing protein n=1 Tax=Archangium violaceum TaxID=83451 RepID=UPI002B2CE826|nr:DUF1585 domain-containing protein [Archangium violaceum]